MKVVIFLGPSLPEAEARDELDATYLPPAAQGDVYRAAREHPFAIGIVDGYFEHLPSVWHKEVLWALSQGIHVFGAASMGAIRAAELARFGMRGVGMIFEAFRSGLLDDDDEVAVAHADAASGYRPLSDAMVNIRGTLGAAVEAGVIGRDLARRLEARAKSLFYPDRTFGRVLAQSLEAGESPASVEAFRAFVASSAVDAKREDARALLRAVRACVQTRCPAAPAAFAFNRTEAWDQLVEWGDAQPPLTALEQPIDLEWLAAEASLTGESGRAAWAASAARAAAATLAASVPATVMTRIRADCDRRWRRVAAAGQDAPAEARFVEWLTRNGLSEGAYPGFVDRDAKNEWAKDRFAADVPRFLADELRESGQYEVVCREARRKQALLAAHGLDNPSSEDVAMDRSALLDWYFRDRLGRVVPSDLTRYCRDAGMDGVGALERRAARELLFERLQARANRR